jgi:hypothetical protein
MGLESDGYRAEYPFLAQVQKKLLLTNIPDFCRIYDTYLDAYPFLQYALIHTAGLIWR